MVRLKMLIKEVTLFRQRMRRVMIKKLRNMIEKCYAYINIIKILCQKLQVAEYQ